MRWDEPAPVAVGGEARRVLGICNACGYCNGFCDVFEAAKGRSALSDGDLEHLANLCHHCRNCLYACQYAAPHAFAVNVPQALARVRWQSYGAYVWPRALAPLLQRNVLAALSVASLAVVLVVVGVLAAVPKEILLVPQSGPGAFYRILPWWAMMSIGVLPLGWSTLAIALGLRRFWRATGGSGGAGRASGAGVEALGDILSLRNLRGGGPGCNDLDDRSSHRRRRLHHALFYGVLLCLASTSAATFYHHALGIEAPYPRLSLPVLLGTFGGIGMLVGTLGLVWMKGRADPEPTAPETRGADYALLALLFGVAASGLLLLGLRETSAMGLLLAVHLGLVLALFLLLPYSRFVHGGYRAAALLREAMGRRRGRPTERDRTTANGLD